MLGGLCENGESYNYNHNHSFILLIHSFLESVFSIATRKRLVIGKHFVTIFSSNNSNKNNDNLFTHITPTSLQKLVETCTCLKTTI